MNKVENLGNFWQMTAPYVAVAQEMTRKEEKRRASAHYFAMDEERRSSFDDYDLSPEDLVEKVVEQISDIEKILKKADISLKLYPFKPEKNKNGEIVGFVPKGKNEQEVKENIERYKEELQKALETGKISQEEFDKLNDNLEELMEANDIKLDNEIDMEITNDKIEENLEGFVTRNFGSELNFDKFCKDYENFDLDERKNCLQEFNSKINTQLGIAGDLKFSTNPNLKFENSFTDKGYYLTEQQVDTQSLKPILYAMMEKSMIRELEVKNEQKISDQKKKEMHKKIMEERARKYKKYKDGQDRKNAQKSMQRMRSIYGNN